MILVRAFSSAVDAQDVLGNTFMHILMRNRLLEASSMSELVEWLFLSQEIVDTLNVINSKGHTVYDEALLHQCTNLPLLKQLLLHDGNRSSALFAQVLHALGYEEYLARQRFFKQEEEARSGVQKTCFQSALLTTTFVNRKAALFSKEAARRQGIIAKEMDAFENRVMPKFTTRYLRLLEQEQVRRTQAAFFLQRVARGYNMRRALVRQQAKEAATTVVDVPPVTSAPAVSVDGCPTSTSLLSDAQPIGSHVVCSGERTPPAHYDHTSSRNTPSKLTDNAMVEHELLAPRTADSEQPIREEEKVAAASRIQLFFRRWSFVQRERRAEARRHQASTAISAWRRGIQQRNHYTQLRNAVLFTQRRWQQRQIILAAERQQATDRICSALRLHYSAQMRHHYIMEHISNQLASRKREVLHAVTRLVWRENFCCACKDLLVALHRRRWVPPTPPRPSRWERVQSLKGLYAKYVLLAQLVISALLLIYIGIVPRTLLTRVHNDLDIVIICLQFVVALMLPWNIWLVFDLCLIVGALIYAAVVKYGGAIAVTFLLFKFPFVVRAFVPEHSGTRTYCRALMRSIYYLVLLFPFAIAGIGSSVRGLAQNSLLVTSDGNWGSVFLYLWSTVSPQYAATILTHTPRAADELPDSPVFHVRYTKAEFHVLGDYVLQRFRIPIAQVAICNAFLLIYPWAATFLGTHSAIMSHYEISDETKLKKNRARFRNQSKMELLDAHRAPNMEALREQVDGIMWADDIRAAKEALEAAQYDRRGRDGVQRFVRNVEQSVSAGNAQTTSAGLRVRTADSLAHSIDQAWDCRNEDPGMRAIHDMEVIEVALSATERKSFGIQVMERQWTGPATIRESNVVLLVMLIMSAVQPNNKVMEGIFSAVLLVEFLLSIYFLRMEYIFTHYVALILRLFCIVVGFVPAAFPLVALRALRLCEGWSFMLTIPGMVMWSCAYSLASLVTAWMIAFVAYLEFEANHPSKAIGAARCLAHSIRDLLLPAWIVQHIAAKDESVAVSVEIIVCQMLFIPFFLSILLHPLLHIGNFIGRFLRLVLHSLHVDVVEYLDSYIEGATWYRHWRLSIGLPVKMAVRAKMWVYDRWRIAFRHFIDLNMCDHLHISHHLPSAVFPVEVEDSSFIARGRNTEHVQNEIVSTGTFLSLDDALKASRHEHHWLWKLCFISSIRWTRSTPLHSAHAILTLASFAFLWASTSSSHSPSSLRVVAAVVHVLSVVSALVVLPRNRTGVLTVVSCATLLAAVAIGFSTDRSVRVFAALRFVSLLRIFQIQVFPLSKVQRFLESYLDSGVRILLPALLVGLIFFVVEVVKAHYVDHPGKSLEAVRSNIAHQFTEDSNVLYSIFSWWVCPALCMSSCIAYLYWSGGNLRNSRSLLINTIPLLEDPVSMLGFHRYDFYYRWVGNGVLVISLVFGCIFSPSSTVFSRDEQNYNFFFSWEVFFTLVGLLSSVAAVSAAVHRCVRTWTRIHCFNEDERCLNIWLGDAILMTLAVMELLYYAFALPLAVTLLMEKDVCLISADNYAVIFICVRFIFILRLTPRQYALSFFREFSLLLFAVITILIYFFGSSSAMCDVAVAATDVPITPSMWHEAFNELVRQIFTSAVPAVVNRAWQPYNATSVALDMMAAGTSVELISNNYSSAKLLFALAVIGKVLLSTTCGLVIAVLLVPFRGGVPLPPKAQFMYNTLFGGIDAILREGAKVHDDMRPQVRLKMQRQKLRHVFTLSGIPLWTLPHLLEELNICRPANQRRFMFALRQLLTYLPIREKRQLQVHEYMDQWVTYRAGGPAKLSFSSLEVFPPAAKEQTSEGNPLEANPTPQREPVVPTIYVHPLRLIQAIALFELSFPSDSSVETRLWLDFFKSTQKLRGATLMQSLWRMHKAQLTFDADPTRSLRERVYLSQLRRSFRSLQLHRNIDFRSSETFEEAVKHGRLTFNPGADHHDVLDRLRGHYQQLIPRGGGVNLTTAPASPTVEELGEAHSDSIDSQIL